MRHSRTLRCRGTGEERTRRELIPFVNESVDDEDEILLALAEELGDFVPLVGGAQHAHFLLPPLESLATVDETVVRERAVASICSVTAQMPPASVQEHLLPLLQVRLKGVGHRSCMAACCCCLAVHHGSALLLHQPKSPRPSIWCLWTNCCLCPPGWSRGWLAESGRRACRPASCFPQHTRQLRCDWWHGQGQGVQRSIRSSSAAQPVNAAPPMHLVQEPSRTELRAAFLKLCHDETPMVRRAAAQVLAGCSGHGGVTSCC